MKQSISTFERELVHQILLCELCFETCHSIPGFPGLGSHFLPYFYNLNFNRGIDSLHSLLLSNQTNELSLKNYIKVRKENGGNDLLLKEFEKTISELVANFRRLAAFAPRNKITAHLDGDFTHIDFTTGYIMPEILNDLIEITRLLKLQFFPLVNHALADDPYSHIRGQVNTVIDRFVIEHTRPIHL
jgi:hypothetical protein